jgi:hypothetical protein
MDPSTGECVAASKHEAAPPTTATATAPSTAATATTTIGTAAAAAASFGGKTILQRWYYYETFEALGKRPAEPALPLRRRGQPKVSCDGVGGYCRLYDEWGPLHLTGYRRQMGMGPPS